MRRAEAGYLVVLVILLAMHTLMSFPFIIETGDLLLGPYAWVISIYLFSAVIMYFVKLMGYIQTYYLKFHLLSVAAMVMSVVPIFSAFLHILSAVTGGRVFLLQTKRVQDIYKGLNLKDAREQERMKYGSEEIVEDVDTNSDLKEFLTKDMQEYQDEYQGFTDRMDADTLKQKVIESETLFISDDLHDTNRLELERIVNLVTLYGESVLGKLDDEQLKLYEDWLIEQDDTDDFDESAIRQDDTRPIIYSDFDDIESIAELDLDELAEMDINDLS